MADAPRRKPGRPPLDPLDPVSVKVSIRLPSKQFDWYCRRALQRGQSLGEIIRGDLLRRPPATRGSHG